VVDFFGELTVILDLELDGQVLVAHGPIRSLLRRNGDSHAISTIVCRGEPHERAPATADIPYFLTRLEANLAADKIQLSFLCLIDISDAIWPVSAGTRHAG